MRNNVMETNQIIWLISCILLIMVILWLLRKFLKTLTKSLFEGVNQTGTYHNSPQKPLEGSEEAKAIKARPTEERAKDEPTKPLNELKADMVKPKEEKQKTEENTSTPSKYYNYDRTKLKNKLKELE